MREDASELRSHIADLEYDKEHGGDPNALKPTIDDLREELTTLEQQARVEVAVLEFAKNPQKLDELDRLSELTGAERQQIARRAVELHARQGLWQIDYQGVLRPPTARERGEEIQRGVQEIRGKGIALSLELLGGIEALTAAKVGLVAVEARVATEGIGTGVVAKGGRRRCQRVAVRCPMRKFAPGITIKSERFQG